MSDPVQELFQQKLVVINVGLPTFAQDLREQKVPVIEVDWRPPAGGNAKMLALLAKLRKGEKSNV